MSKPACKCKEVECEECPEWIFTLADLIMCMMGLFVILWVLKPSGGGAGATAAEGAPGSAQQQAASQKFYEAIAGIRDGFGYEPDPHSTDPIDLAVMRLRARDGAVGPGKSTQRQNGATGSDDEVTTIRVAPQATVGGRILFAAGQTDLDADAQKMLVQIAQLIRGHRNVILVKGHASMDDFGETATARTNLDLSLRRAQVVADQLMKLGVEQEILRVVGCSTFEPVKERAYSDGQKAQNRRVEVEGTSTLVEQLRDAPRATSTRESRPAPADHP